MSWSSQNPSGRVCTYCDRWVDSGCSACCHLCASDSVVISRGTGKFREHTPQCNERQAQHETGTSCPWHHRSWHGWQCRKCGQTVPGPQHRPEVGAPSLFRNHAGQRPGCVFPWCSRRRNRGFNTCCRFCYRMEDPFPSPPLGLPFHTQECEARQCVEACLEELRHLDRLQQVLEQTE